MLQDCLCRISVFDLQMIDLIQPALRLIELFRFKGKTVQITAKLAPGIPDQILHFDDGKKSDSENIIDFAGLLLNKESHECIYNEQSLPLTPTEFEILWILCENRGKVISSQRLFEEVWHEEYLKNSNNTVMVHIRHLREKLSKPTGKSDLIKTVWGVGYKIEE